jgi:hypothetical protein
MGYLGNAPADQAVQIGTGVVGTSEIEDASVADVDMADSLIIRSQATSVNTIGANTTIGAANTNNFSVGDVTISDGFTVTVPDTSNWLIL